MCLHGKHFWSTRPSEDPNLVEGGLPVDTLEPQNPVERSLHVERETKVPAIQQATRPKQVVEQNAIGGRQKCLTHFFGQHINNKKRKTTGTPSQKENLLQAVAAALLW